MRRIQSLIILALAALLLACAASAESGGACGSALTWSVSGEVLTVSGTGAMYNYEDTAAPWYAEYSSDISSVVIGSGVTTIGSGAFTGVLMRQVTLPKSLKTIGDFAFDSCVNLTTVCYAGTSSEKAKITVGEYNTNLTGAVWSYNGSAPATSGSCGSSLRWNCAGGRLTVSGSGAMPDYSEEGIAPWSPWREDITSLTIAEGATNVGDYAFYGCENLTSAALSSKITSIGLHAFEYCISLKSITLPSGVTEVLDSAFYGCGSLRYAVLPAGLTYVGDSAFDECGSLSKVYCAATKTAAAKISVGSSNAPLTGAAWEYSSTGPSHTASNVTWSCVDGVLTITGTGAIPDYSDDNTAPWNDEYQDEIVSVEIGQGITRIGAYAFDGCTSLASVSIPQDVSSIGEGAFSGCSMLAAVCYGGSDRTGLAISDDNDHLLSAIWAFGGSGIPRSGSCGADLTWNVAGGVLTVSGTGAMDDYSSDVIAPWAPFRAEIVTVTLTGSVTRIGSRAFFGCESLETANVAAGVTSVGDRAFYGCAKLSGALLPQSVTIIGNYAFGNCVSLTAFALPAGVTALGSRAFFGCTGLTAVTIPAGITALPDGVFYRCEGLTSLEIPLSLTSVGSRAFTGCTRLAEVRYTGSEADRKKISIGSGNECLTGASWTYNYMPITLGAEVHWCANGVCRVCGRSFDLSGYETVTVPDSVKTIEEEAFAKTGAQVIVIEGSSVVVETKAFAECASLEYLVMPAAVAANVPQDAVPADTVVILR